MSELEEKGNDLGPKLRRLAIETVVISFYVIAFIALYKANLIGNSPNNGTATIDSGYNARLLKHLHI